jgi:hypothetical protein
MSKKQHTCCICLEDLKNYDALYTPCLHRFHTDCINKWLEQKKYCQKIDCPACRSDIGVLLGENREIRPPEQDELADIEAIISLLNSDLSELYDVVSIDQSQIPRMQLARQQLSMSQIARGHLIGMHQNNTPVDATLYANPANNAMNIGATLTDALISTLLSSVISEINNRAEPNNAADTRTLPRVLPILRLSTRSFL